MAQKDLIIGAFSNYKDYDVLKPWVQSIKDTDFNGDIVLIAIDTSPELIARLEAEGVKVLPYAKQNNMMIHMLRFVYIYDYLSKNEKEYRYVITTDVRDVVFQSNPFGLLDNRVSAGCPAKIIAASEAILIKDEAWNRGNIIKNFGQYFYDKIKDNPVCNVGVFGGRSDYVRDMCFYIYQLSLNRPDWVADQAAYNMLLNMSPWKQVTSTATLATAWALNAHVTSKPDQLDEFGPFLLEERPYMQDGIVRNSFGLPFAIVHQYDRVPEWTEQIHKKYGINMTNETDIGTSPKYFTYKS